MSKVAAEIREGFRFVRSRTWLWGTLACTSVALLVYLGPWEALMPFLVKNELEESARSLGPRVRRGRPRVDLRGDLHGTARLPGRMITSCTSRFAVGFVGADSYGLPARLAALSSRRGGLGGARRRDGVWTTLMQRHVPGSCSGA